MVTKWKTGEVFYAPAGTPLPGTFDPFEYYFWAVDRVRERVAEFLADHDGKPYAWGGPNRAIAVSFDMTGFAFGVRRALFFPKRRGLFTRSTRHRRNNLRRKRAARHRRHRR